jgi:hypothetical protein
MPGLQMVWARLAVGLLTAAVPMAAQPKLPNPFGKSARSVDAPNLDRMTDHDFYGDLKAYADVSYNREPASNQDREFKREVDAEYQDLLRRHADLANRLNISSRSEIRYVNEDRIHIFAGLYDNLLAQDCVTQNGLSVIGDDTDHLYVFKLFADPIPRAEALATGSIYISTGLMALLDSPDQLAYILSHEAAHIRLRHYKTNVMLSVAADKYADSVRANREAVVRRFTLLGGSLGAGVGSAAGRQVAPVSVDGALVGLPLDSVQVDRMQRDSLQISWTQDQEDEADQAAVDWMLRERLDVKRILTLYGVLHHLEAGDERIPLAFFARPDRVRERVRKIEELIASATLPQSFAASDPLSVPGSFQSAIGEVARDNGVLAYQNDMLGMARENLERAAILRPNDATVLYYLGKVLKATSRSDEERRIATDYFKRASAADNRNLAYGANLHRALALNDSGSDTERNEVLSLIRQYVQGYLSSVEPSRQPVVAAQMDRVYDYLGASSQNWTLTPGPHEQPITLVTPPDSGGPSKPDEEPLVLRIRNAKGKSGDLGAALLLIGDRLDRVADVRGPEAGPVSVRGFLSSPDGLYLDVGVSIARDAKPGIYPLRLLRSDGKVVKVVPFEVE